MGGEGGGSVDYWGVGGGGEKNEDNPASETHCTNTVVLPLLRVKAAFFFLQAEPGSQGTLLIQQWGLLNRLFWLCKEAAQFRMLRLFTRLFSHCLELEG